MAKTTLDDDVTKPSVTEPGDGPADTVDPLERASTVVPRPGPDALKAGTVNGQLPLEPITAAATGRRSKDDRVEEYPGTDAFGNEIRIVRNVETGERRLSKGADTGAVPTQQSGR